MYYLKDYIKKLCAMKLETILTALAIVLTLVLALMVLLAPIPNAMGLLFSSFGEHSLAPLDNDLSCWAK